MLLAFDIGSSSVKAAILRTGNINSRIARIAYKTQHSGPRVEVEPKEVLGAIHRAIQSLGSKVRSIDAIALSVMSPAWVLMDKQGKAITSIVTHQDRRSVVEASEIERRIGKTRHLSIAGVRPIPGGIASTTWAWFHKHHRATVKRADLCGLLNTFLIRSWTGQRVIDPSNANFMGIYAGVKQSGWSEELCENVSMPKRMLPEIIESNNIAGTMTRSAAASLGLTPGVPIFAGMIDTSAAMLLTGAKAGQLLNTCGSTDVLAILTTKPRPHERLITRAFGIGKRWMSVSTMAAAGSALAWAHDQLFADYSWERFNRLIDHLASQCTPSIVRCEPNFAGDRMSVEQPSASFAGLTLSTTRTDLLKAMIESLSANSAARLPLLLRGGVKPLKRVVVTGKGYDHVMRRDWGGRWTFHREDEASLRGLGKLIEL